MDERKSGGQKIPSLLKALILSYAVSALILFLLAFLLYRFSISEGVVKAGVLAVYVISCLAGGWYIGRKTGNRKFAWGFLAGILYFLVLLLVSMIVSHSVAVSPIQLVTTLALCVCGGTVGGMLS